MHTLYLNKKKGYYELLVSQYPIIFHHIKMKKKNTHLKYSQPLPLYIFFLLTLTP